LDRIMTIMRALWLRVQDLTGGKSARRSGTPNVLLLPAWHG
jgi:hypothetical protein